MRLEQIKYFVTISRCCSISLAAAELNISQPSISVAISDLEQELGVKLFDRTRRGTILSEEARPFLEEARNILTSVENFLELSKKFNNRPKKLHLACVTSVPKSLLSNIFLLFKRDFPQVTLDIVTQGSLQTIKALQDWSIDVGIITTYVIPDNYKNACDIGRDDPCAILSANDERFNDRLYVKKLFTSRLGLCMSTERAQKYGGSCSLDDLAGETLMSTFFYKNTLACYLSKFHSFFAEENVSMYIRDYANLFHLCSQDAGIFISNESIFLNYEKQFEGKISFVHIEDEIPVVEYVAACLQSNAYIPSFKNYLELLGEVTEMTSLQNKGIVTF